MTKEISFDEKLCYHSLMKCYLVLPDLSSKTTQEYRVRGIVGSMIETLPFEKESLDLIWSEGAIYNIGFERGLIGSNTGFSSQSYSNDLSTIEMAILMLKPIL